MLPRHGVRLCARQDVLRELPEQLPASEVAAGLESIVWVYLAYRHDADRLDMIAARNGFVPFKSVVYKPVTHARRHTSVDSTVSSVIARRSNKNSMGAAIGAADSAA